MVLLEMALENNSPSPLSPLLYNLKPEKDELFTYDIAYSYLFWHHLDT